LNKLGHHENFIFFLEHIQDVHKFKLNSTLESTERLMLQQEQAGIFFEADLKQRF